MARLPRLSLPGEAHLVVQRGNPLQPLFVDDEDRVRFVRDLREAASQHRLAIHAYALLDDAFWLLATPAGEGSLSRALQALGRHYVASFNRRHGRSGMLWSSRFKATIIESERYLLDAMKMVELSPVRAGLAADAGSWPWSSAAHHLGRRSDPVVTHHPLFWRLGNTPFDREAAHRHGLEQGVPTATSHALEDATLKGWALGSPGFLARLADRTDRPLAARNRGRPRKLPSSGAAQ